MRPVVSKLQPAEPGTPRWLGAPVRSGLESASPGKAVLAFSRIDLLSILAVIGFFLLLLMPALGRTRTGDRGVACLNNLRQLVVAWTMYAQDNHDRLPPNHDGGVHDLRLSWAAGWEDFTANNSDNTNTLFLVGTQLGQYTKNAALYKCPSDIYLCTIAGLPMPRVRSVSMNAFIEGGAYKGDHGPGDSHWFSGWYAYDKMSDIRLPSPAMLWVFADEHPDSINDAWFVTNVPDPDYWSDLPASYHNGAGSFAFADGHIELKKWVEPTTLVPVLQQQRTGFPAPGSQDTRWVIAHASAPSH